MTPLDLVFLLWMQPCHSPLEAAPRQTVVTKCAPGAVPELPPWWRPGMLERAPSVRIAAEKYTYPVKAKKKSKKRRRR